MNREVAQEQILRDFFRLLRRQWVVIVGTVVVAVGVAIAYSVLKEPVYKASAELRFVSQSEYLPEVGLGQGFTGVDPAKRAAQDAERVTSPEVVDAVANEVDSDLTNDEIEDSVSTAVDPDSNLVTLTVEADDGKLAGDLANAFASETRQVLTEAERSRLQRAAKELDQSVEDEDDGSIAKVSAEQTASRLRSLAEVARPVEVASQAEEPSEPTSPQPVRDTILALILGLIFGTLLAFLRDSLDRRLTDAHEVQRELEIPMLGYVQADSLGTAGAAENGRRRRPSESGLEAFRILRSNLEFLAVDKNLRTVAVTSAVAEEGKSTVAAGLATAAALADKQVLLVECDLRRPVFADRFEIDATPGLTDWAVGHANPPDVIQRVSIELRNGNQDILAKANESSPSSPWLTAISAGTFSPQPAELLGSQRFRDFVQEVRGVYDLVILDCAPLLPVGDTLEVLPLADAALLCVRLGQTTSEQANAAKAAIDHLPERPVGLVLTGVKPGREGYYYGYYAASPRAQTAPAVVIAPTPGQTSGLPKQ